MAGPSVLLEQAIKPAAAEASQFRHWTPITIRFSDQDSVGHVNNVSYAAYFEAGRIDFMSRVLVSCWINSLNYDERHKACG